MKKGDIQPFSAFMAAEAMRYARELPPVEIATWFENFPSVTLDDFVGAWEMHKASDKGHFFPRIVDLQRLLKTVHRGAKSDRSCAVLHSKITARCRYPGSIAVDKNKPICRCHYRLFSMPHEEGASDVIVENSASRSMDEVYAELCAKSMVPAAEGGMQRITRPVQDIAEAIADAVAYDEANRDDLLAQVAAHQARQGAA
jgi:hypothetical protein